MTSPLKNHITHISNSLQAQFPRDHVKYLNKLKSDGFEPKVIYDIGSCVLHWTREAQKLWPDAKIYLFDAFEPAEFLYTGYEYHIGVLSDEDDKTVKFYQNNHWFGGNSYYRELNHDHIFPPDRYIEKVCKTLDTVARERNFPPPDLIKIDVQGAEKDVISGARETLRSVEHLLVEMQSVHYNDGAPLVGETLPFIESFGFTCVAPKFADNGPDADYGFKRNLDV